ncbi:LbetaH domain-containing protein [Planobacterium oryzisoli]|uniref:Transferase n=1 Tax=Planobacterium oryzisoli TaxID=2771435 RepID=A0A930YVJ2_9FLAO|nr:hypothetical protein [Planobacterium oryzisoli]MBF5027130.1 hypothetical protein [Planobacterium oryzisoli]
MEAIKKMFRIVRLIFKINWIKTLYINFKTQKFSDAIRLPIVVFGRLKLYSLRGKVKIKYPISFGIVIIGKDFDHFPNSLLPVKLLVNNELIFNGPTIISGGTTITSWTGVIDIGKYTSIGSGNVIKSNVKITIGDYSRVVSNCVLMDTNVHFVIDANNRINNIFDEIFIDKYCWINAGTVLSKGARLPKYTITGRNSYISKDFSKQDEGLLLVGSPAVIKGNGFRKIFNYRNESLLKEYFLNNLSEKSIDLNYLTSDIDYIETDMDFKSFYKLY